VQAHAPLDELFTIYQHTLQLLCDSEVPMVVVMRFELALLKDLGHMPDLWQEDGSGRDIVPEANYGYGINVGLSLTGVNLDHHGSVPITGDLLIAMRQPEAMSLEHYHQLRRFLDAIWLRIVRKPFNSRKLLRFD